MGNGAKIALVALLILMVVVIARFVREGTSPEDSTSAEKGSSSKGLVAKDPSGKSPATQAPTGKAAARATPPIGPRMKIADKGSWSAIGRAPGQAESPGSPGRPPAEAVPPKVPGASVGAAGAPSAPGEEGRRRDPQPGVATSGTGDAGTPGAGAAGSGTVGSSRGPQPPESVAAQAEKRAEGEGGTKIAESDLLAHAAKHPGPIVGGGVELPIRTRLEEKSALTPGDPKSEATPPGAKTQDPKPPVAEVFPKSHVLQAGENFYKLARLHYGKTSKAYIEAIQRANPGARMWVGDTLTIPEPPTEVAKPAAPKAEEPRTGLEKDPKPGPTPREPAPTPPRAKDSKPKSPPEAGAQLAADRIHVVQRGESLWSLAEKYYGNGSKKDLIIDANPQYDLRYRELIAGAKLRIPAR